MIRVGLARTKPSYAGLAPPYHPSVCPPELVSLLGEQPDRPANSVHDAVRSALHCLGLDDTRFGTPDWNPLSELVAAGASIVLKPNFIRHWNPC